MDCPLNSSAGNPVHRLNYIESPSCGARRVSTVNVEAVNPHRSFADRVALLVPLADEPGEKQTTQAPTAQQAASDQDTCEPVILAAAQ
jgi:hypothetical protein